MGFVRLVHHHPGQLRLRSADFRAPSARVQGAIARLRDAPGVRELQHDARTGSVRIAYVLGAVEPDVLVRRVADEAGLSVYTRAARAAAERDAVPRAIVRTARAVNRAVSALASERADARSLASVALAGLSVYSFVKSPQRLPRWDSLAFWSLSLFNMLHERDEIRAWARTP
jgi:hypothetical protein